MPTRIAVLMMLLVLCAAEPAAGQPKLTVCLVNLSSNGLSSLYSANIDWGDMKENQYARFEVMAEDGTGASWPQFGSDSFRPPAEHRKFSVDNSSSKYPLSFILVGLSREAADRFDGYCRGGDGCSIDLGDPGVTVLERGNIVSNPSNAPKC